MLGFYVTKLDGHRFNFWLGCCLGLVVALVEILSFGYLSADWGMRWSRYYLHARKIDYSWIFHYISRGKLRKE